MIKPTPNDIGRRVVYARANEEGTITSIGKHFIFVRYGNDTGSKATLPGDLRWKEQTEPSQGGQR